MPPIFTIPLEKVRAEVEHNNSRFIATLGPVSSTDEARAFIRSVKTEFPDASHNVSAYIIGGGKNIVDYCSDDGEPSGTAGKPVLTVIRGSGLGDVAVVVTRYFGGILLGTGGLVKAYTDAVQEVLKRVTHAHRVSVTIAAVEFPYPLFERMRLLLTKNGAEILSEDFSGNVMITFQIPVEDLNKCDTLIQDLTSGKSEIVELGSSEKLVRV